MAQDSLYGELAIVLDMEKEKVEEFITERMRVKSCIEKQSHEIILTFYIKHIIVFLKSTTKCERNSMDRKNLIDYLVAFGLTGQEALVYLELFRSGKSTGYEVSKATGISRSNAYKALEGLTDKGAACVSEGTAKKYTAVGIEEFCQNKIRTLQERKEYLIAHMPREKEDTEGYITIRSDENISDKVKSMLERAEKRVYISMAQNLLAGIETELEALVEKKIKVVILTDKPFKLNGAKVYQSQNRKNQIGIITDSSYVLTGELGKGRESTCLYSGQVNFVQVFKDSMKNEIRLLELDVKDKK